MSVINTAAAFRTAHTAIRKAITALRGIGHTPDNGPFGHVMADLERICQVCQDGERAESKPVAEAAHTDTQERAMQPTGPVACKGCKAKCNPAFVDAKGYCRKSGCQAKATAEQPKADKPATPKPEAVKPAAVKQVETANPANPPARKADARKAELLKQYAALGGNAGLAAKWGVEALERNIAKLKAAAQTVTPKAEQTPAAADVPAKGTLFQADGKGGLKVVSVADVLASVEEVTLWSVLEERSKKAA